MKSIKRRVETYSLFDRGSISAHLEKMAERGWMISRITGLYWEYKKIEPQKLHFEVSYYAKASEFDPEPSEGQRIFQEFCAHTGWKLACTAAQMMIFYNEGDAPTPIETDPALETEAIHKAARKGFLPAHYVLLAISIMQGVMLGVSLKNDLIGVLSSTSRLFSAFCLLLVGVICAAELINYYAWRQRAVRAARRGEGCQMPSIRILQKTVMLLALAAGAYWAADIAVHGRPWEKMAAVLILVYMPTMFIAVNAVKKFLKRRKAGRKVNRAVTMAVSAVLSVAMLALITAATIKGFSRERLAASGEQTYMHNGRTWVAHQDELPLTIEDLTNERGDEYIRERRAEESPLIKRVNYTQYPRFDAENYIQMPEIRYTVVEVKTPLLYRMCRNSIMREYEEDSPIYERRYIKDAGAPWGAEEGYRLYDGEYGYENRYLLCYEKRIVEIDLSWDPTKEQMRTAGERLTISGK